MFQLNVYPAQEKKPESVKFLEDAWSNFSLISMVCQDYSQEEKKQAVKNKQFYHKHPSGQEVKDQNECMLTSSIGKTLLVKLPLNCTACLAL